MSLHVLHLVPRALHARFGRMFRQLGLALEEEGLRVSLASDDPRLIADVTTSPIQECAVRAFTGWRSLGLVAELDRIYESPPQLVHCWGAAALAAGRRLLRRAPLPILTHLTSIDELSDAGRTPPRRGESLAVVCERHASMLRGLRAGGTLVPSIIEPGLLAPDRHATRTPADHVVGVLWLGSADSPAGATFLLDTVSVLAKSKRDVHVVIHAPGPAGDRLWKSARQRSINEFLTVLDDDLVWDRSLAGFDICVIPDTAREASLAPLLAMALGAAVVCAREQSLDWLVADETALTFSPADAQSLADRIDRLIQRQPIDLATTRAAADYVRRQHSLSKMAKHLTELYGTLVEDWRRSQPRVGSST